MTFVYTSGTTGPPKAVMSSHDNYIWVAKIIYSQLKDLGFSDCNERFVSYLPLCHSAGQFVDFAFASPVKGCVYMA
jgi:long-subunit acyl-CoA synthetase (AMP-forming)